LSLFVKAELITPAVFGRRKPFIVTTSIFNHLTRIKEATTYQWFARERERERKPYQTASNFAILPWIPYIGDYS
jgi:hypothetical protein